MEVSIVGSSTLLANSAHMEDPPVHHQIPTTVSSILLLRALDPGLELLKHSQKTLFVPAFELEAL